MKANLILSCHVKKKERSAINITCSKYLVSNKRETDGKTKRWGEKKIAKVNTDSDNKKKKRKEYPSYNAQIKEKSEKELATAPGKKELWTCVSSLP